MSDLHTYPHVYWPTRPTGCQAFAAKTGKQCGVYWIDSHFCSARGHKQKGKCCAIKREDGKRCMNFITKDGRGFFCGKHKDWATPPDETVCEGFKVSDGSKCYRRATDPNYPYCMTSHDTRVNHFDPNMFREGGLRGRVLSRLRERDGDRDLYNSGKTILGNAKDYHVDHRVEIQQFSYCWQFDIFKNSEEKNDVMKFARDEFVNTLLNLVATWSDTNLRKGRAVTNVLEDLMKFSLIEYGQLDVRSLKDIRTTSFNAPIVATLDDRLIEQGLGRDSTRVIRRDMGRSLQYWKYKCLDQGETPIYDVLGGIAGDIFTVFDLYVGTDLLEYGSTVASTLEVD